MWGDIPGHQVGFGVGGGGLHPVATAVAEGGKRAEANCELNWLLIDRVSGSAREINFRDSREMDSSDVPHRTWSSYQHTHTHTHTQPATLPANTETWGVSDIWALITPPARPSGPWLSSLSSPGMRLRFTRS